MQFRPCGACAALVPAASGCTHWRGAGSRIINGRSVAAIEAKRKRDRERRQRIRDEQAGMLAAFRRQQGLA